MPPSPGLNTTEGQLPLRLGIYAVSVLLTAVLAAPATAARYEARVTNAYTPHRPGWRIAQAERIADAMWGPAPCGQVTIQRHAWIPSFLESHALAATDAENCIIYLRPNWKPAGWGDLCTVILHERGHIDGYTDPTNTADPAHSGDPNNLMAADYLLQVNYVRRHGRLREFRQSGNWRCWSYGQPYLNRAGGP